MDRDGVGRRYEMKCVNCNHWLTRVSKAYQRKDGRKVVHSYGGVCCKNPKCVCHDPVEQILVDDFCKNCGMKMVKTEYVTLAELKKLMKEVK